MMIIPFPPRACRFFLRGVCFRQEALNPGFHDAFRCAMMARLIQEWDNFVERADGNGLSAKQAVFLWQTLPDRVFRAPEKCPFQNVSPFRRGNVFRMEILECEHLVDYACLLALPRCERRCEYYAPITRNSDSDTIK
jgi:hypothetical protein